MHNLPRTMHNGQSETLAPTGDTAPVLDCVLRTVR